MVQAAMTSKASATRTAGASTIYCAGLQEQNGRECLQHGGPMQAAVTRCRRDGQQVSVQALGASIEASGSER